MASKVASLRLVVALAALAVAPLCSAAVQADDPAEKKDRGLATLVRVRLPITGNADQALRSTLGRARDRLVSEARARHDGRRPALVIEITPAPGAAGAGEGSQFERALALARFVAGRDMTDVKTVAYLPESIRGHGVLLAIACEEMIMAPEAEIGDAGAGEDVSGGATVVAAYREIADARRTVPEALAVGMVDSAVEVLQVESDEGIRFLLGNELDDYRENHEVIDERTLAPRGTAARFTGREGREFGFVRFLANDLAATARSLDVPVESLREDQSLLVDWEPIVLEIDGPLTPQLASELETSLGNELKRGVNWICVRIDSSGGDLAASVQVATMLADLDANAVRTVAYVPMEARGGAALAALACDQLVVHPEARIGVTPTAAPAIPPPDRKLPPPAAPRLPNLLPDPDEGDALDQRIAAVTSIRQALAPRTEQPWSLLAAMIDPAVEVFEYRNRTTGQRRLMSATEADSLPNADDWKRGPPLADDNGELLLNGPQAEQLGVAWQVVDSFDGLKQLYGIDADPPLVKPNWAQRMVQAMAAPGFSVMLLVIGFAGVYIEMRTPGVGIGGFVAALAFVLFFWSKALDQTAGWLEVVLFITGVFFILMEVFVLPGFGIFGLGGGAMVIFALILASQTFVIPRTESDLAELRNSIAVVAAAGVGVIALAFGARRYLPRAPVFNRIVLEPPRPEERLELESRESIVDYSHLVGQGGTAATDLRPSGKAMIGDELIDVIAEAEPLDRGASIVVVDAHASRVVVRGV